MRRSPEQDLPPAADQDRRLLRRPAPRQNPPVSAADGVRRLARLQNDVVDGTRLGISFPPRAEAWHPAS